MSLLANIFGNKKHPPGKEAVVADEDAKPSTPVQPDMNAIEAEVLEQLRQAEIGSGIDIDLNQPIPDNPEANISSRCQEEGIDIDLANLSADDTHSRTANVLSFNPLKTFSHPVELNLDELFKKGYITPANANTLLGNTFRLIKRPLLNNIMGKGATVVDNANLIMITSSLSGEGKTYSAINLAISMAMEKDKQVLLVDADVNKPSHHELFGFEAENGLTDLLMGKVKDMSQVLYRTNIPSLTLMPAGNKTTHATELLASEAMSQFVKEVSGNYDNRVIIFDSPPLLLPTEASVLASHMGQVVVVVEAEKTLRNDVKKSLGMLTNKIVLLLLNQARETSKHGNYGYYQYDDPV